MTPHRVFPATRDGSRVAATDYRAEAAPDVTRGGTVAVVTCAEVADLEPDDRLIFAPLADAGLAAEAAGVHPARGGRAGTRTP